MMTPKNNFKVQLNHALLIMHILVGAEIGLLRISIFKISAGEPHPGWGKFWMIKPLTIVPLAGAVGGVCYFLMVHSLPGWFTQNYSYHFKCDCIFHCLVEGCCFGIERHHVGLKTLTDQIIIFR